MAKRDDDKATEKSADKVQAAVDVETEQGFRGHKVDPTPDENYTAAGAAAGKPTPETDEKAAEKARKARVEVEKRT